MFHGVGYRRSGGGCCGGGGGYGRMFEDALPQHLGLNILLWSHCFTIGHSWTHGLIPNAVICNPFSYIFYYTWIILNYEYFVPDFSYFRIKQLEVGENNVILTAERHCQLNK